MTVLVKNNENGYITVTDNVNHKEYIIKASEITSLKILSEPVSSILVAYTSGSLIRYTLAESPSKKEIVNDMHKVTKILGTAKKEAVAYQSFRKNHTSDRMMNIEIE